MSFIWSLPKHCVGVSNANPLRLGVVNSIASNSSGATMPGVATEDRRARERAARRRLIVDTARQLAEAEGWNAVTTRRLSTEIEYSQPVLYKHFSGMDQIAAAVAVDGFGELARLRSRGSRRCGNARRCADPHGACLSRLRPRQPRRLRRDVHRAHRPALRGGRHPA